jgi:hypothetical protein
MKFLEALRSALARKILAGVAILFLAVGILGFLALPHFLRPFLENTLSEKLHRPVKVAELAINPYAMSATVKGFSVGEREGSGELAGFDELYVNLEASSLIHLAPVVRQLRVRVPRLHLVRNGDKTYNISDLIEEFLNKPDEPASHFALYNIQVSGGRIVFDDKPEARRHEVAGLELGIPFISNLPSEVDIFVQPSLAGKVNGAGFALGGKARPFAQTREVNLELALADLDLTPYLDYVPVALNFTLPSARLDTKLKLAFTQPVAAPAGLSVSGELTLRKVQMQTKDGRPILDLPKAILVLKSLDVLAGKADVESLSVESPNLHVARLKDGSLSLMRLATAAPATAKSTPTSKSPIKSSATQSNSTPFSFSLGQFRISDGSLSLADEMPVQPVVVKVLGLDVKLDHLGLAGGELKGKSGLALGLTSLSMQAQGEKKPVFQLGTAHAVGEADGGKRELVLSEVRAEGGQLALAREMDGSLSLERLLPRAVAQGAGKRAPAESTSDRKSTRLNSSHNSESRMPSSA